MEDNEEKKNLETTAESVENNNAESEKETKTLEKTFTRDELNKIVNAEKEKALNEFKAKIESQKEEAEKLAKMDKDQKKDYEIQQLRERAEKAERKNAVSELKAETIRQADDKGIPLSLIESINFECETAETIAVKLDLFQKTINKQRELVIEEYSREDPPQTGDKVDDSKPENQMTYEELCQLPKYKN